MKLHALDIAFRLEGGKLKINAPDGVLNDALLAELKTHKNEIIELLKRSTINKSTVGQIIPKAPRRDRFPLSYAQQRLWFLYRLEPNSPAYHMTGGIRVRAPIDSEKLRCAFEEIICRHESLRTSFIEDNNQPWQLIQRPYRLDIECVNCPLIVPSAIESYLKNLADQSGREPYDLTKGGLFRVTLVRIAVDHYFVLVNMHHIISDGWSVGLLLEELSRLYEGYHQGREVQLEPLPIQYVDYAVWQRDYLQGEVLSSQIDYWRETLQNAPSLLPLPLDHLRPAVQSHRGAVVKFKLDAELISGLQGLARREGVTLFMVLLAGYHLLLSRLSGQTDVCVGIPVAGRTRRELEGLIGFFINAVVIRLDMSGKPTLSELFRQVKEKTLGAYGHQEVPAELLLEALKVERNLSYGPLAQVGFTLQNIPSGEGFRLGGVEAEIMEYGQVTAKYDLTLLLKETLHGIDGVAEYATDLFECSTIERFIDQYERVLRQLISLECERRITTIELASGDVLLEELELDDLRHSAIYPLTSMQRDLYLSWRLRPETLENSLGYAVELHHEVGVEAWTAALQRYTKEYGVLRSELVRGTRSWHADVYRVELNAEEAALPLEVLDLSDQSWDAKEIAALIRSRIERPYTEGGPLLNHYLYKLGQNHWLTIMASHHLLLDGVGYATHLLGVCRLYEQRLRGEELEKLPSDGYDIAIVRDQAEVDRAEVLNFWQEELRDLEALSWRVDKNLGHERRRLRISLGAEERQQIQHYCRRHKVTPALYWKSLYCLLISGLTVGAGDVVLQEFTSGRLPNEDKELGCYYRLQPYVLRRDLLHIDARFSDWLEAARDFHRRSRPYDAISILSQNRWLGARELAYLYNYVHFYPELEVCGHKERIEQLIPQAEGAVQFVVKGVGQGLELSLDGDCCYLPRGDELELMWAVSRRLQSGVDELSGLYWSESQESRYATHRWQEEQIKSPGILPLLERSLQQYTAQEALVCGSQRLTYAELERLSRKWLERLTSLGLKPGSLVILNARRSVAGIVGWLALVRLGCCYIPLEGDQPLERLKWLCQESGASLLFQESGLARLGESASIPVQTLSLKPKSEMISKKNVVGSGGDVDEAAFNWKGVPDDPERLFYQIYTSGSTGEPKGVQIREGGVTHLCHWYIDEYGFKASDRHLLLGSLNFDLTQKNLYGVLASGGTLVLPEVGGYDADLLQDQIEREQVTVINGAPSVIYPLLTESSGSDLRLILFGGERVELSRIRDWVMEHQTVELVNMYGPTECTDISTASRQPAEWILSAAESGTEWSLGQPIPGVVVEVRNRFGRAVPLGVEGEFWIGGAGVGLGYTDEVLTAIKFVGEGSTRRYRSGDRGYEICADHNASLESIGFSHGELVYLGRLDRQVKLRGMRLELGEIEAALRRGLDGAEAYAEVVDDQLVGYLRIENSNRVKKMSTKAGVVSEWRSRLRSYLPEGLIPGRLIEVESWPLTVNGKLDRNRLQELAREQPKQSGVTAPRTEREAELLLIWRDVLGREHIGIHDNFFELGGHSLLATQLLSRLRERYRIELPLRDLFTAVTIEAQGHLLDEQLASELTENLNMGESTIPKVERTDPLPASYAQQRLWFLEQIGAHQGLYNMSAALRLHGQLDIERLKLAFSQLMVRHDALRSEFVDAEGIPFIHVLDSLPLPLYLHDCTTEELTEDKIKTLVNNASTIQFDLAKAPLFRLDFYSLNDETFILIAVMHHIISDGWSVGVLLDELSRLYEGDRQGLEVYLEPLPVQYIDYAAWQRERMQGEVLRSQIDYWQETLKNSPSLLSLPLDHPRPAMQSHRGAVVKFNLKKELVDGLKELARREGLTLFMALLVGYHLLLSRLSGQTDVCVGIPVAGRTRRELEGLIGFFINAVVIRLDLSGKPTLSELFSRIKEKTLGAYSHQEVPAESLLEALKIERNLSYGPLAQVSFALQNIPLGEGLRLGGVEAERLEYGQVTAKYDLTLLLEETEKGINGVAEYATDIFEHSTIEQFLAQYKRVLSQLVSLESGRRITAIDLVSGEALLKELGLERPNYADIYPLTSMQRDLYLSWRLRPQTLENSLGYAVELHHEVDVPAWVAALRRYTDQYGVLRSELVRGARSWHDEVYRVEKRADKAVLPLEVTDLSAQSWNEEEIATLIRSRIECPYTEGQPLLNHYLYKLGQSHWLTIMASHHLLLDGVGYATHLLGVCRLYEQSLRGEAAEELPADRYVIAIERDQEEVDSAEVLSYWQEQLSGVEALGWRTDDALGNERRRLRASLNEEERQQIQRYCRRHKITPALYWKSVYSLLISGLTVETGDVVLQEFSSGRLPNEERELGCYYRLQPYVLRRDALHMEARFSDWLDVSREFHRQSRRYDSISILSQNRWLGVREPAYLYNYVHFYPELEVCGRKERIEQWIPQAEGAVQFVVKNVGQGMELNLDAAQRYLPRGDELELILALSRSLQDGIDELSDLHWNESQESLYVMHRWQEEQTKGPGVRQLLERSLRHYLEQEALVCGSQRITYAELERLSRIWLKRFVALGLKPGSSVILNARRSVAGIVGWLSLVRLGCCYIPLEGNQPVERLKWLCQESGAVLLLQEPGLTSLGVDESIPVQVLSLDSMSIDAIDNDEAVFTWHGIPDDLYRLFYQIYTSGSTGEPKGVQVGESGVNHLCRWYIDEYDFKPADRHLLLGSLSFDLTQKNLYGVLASGGTLVLPEVEGYDAELLRGQLERERVTVMNGAPSVIYPLLTEDAGSTLRLVLFGGERVELGRIRDWVMEHQSVELVNMYGPTECTDISTTSRHAAEWLLVAAEADEVWSLGHPIPGVIVEIKNRFGRAVPSGVEGEFWIGGTGVGLGYTDAALTAEKFIGEGDSRRYRSGDRGYELTAGCSAGELIYLGRLDRQVKLRGIRLELGEIEAALRRALDVSEAYAEVVDDRLVGYLRVDDSNTVKSSSATSGIPPDWRARLEAYLSVGLVPSRLIEMKSWPLTVNGKLDRNRLQELTRQEQEHGEVSEPRTGREAELRAIWQEVLHRDRIGIYDNFFELGGHSLLATQLISRLRERYRLELPLRELFLQPTIAGLANALDELAALQALPSEAVSPIMPVSRVAPLPLSQAQERLWLVQRLNPQSTAYNMPVAVRLRGEINWPALTRAIKTLFERHDVFRSRFVEDQGQVQVLLDVMPESLIEQASSCLGQNNRDINDEDYIRAEVEQFSRRAFDLSTGPLYALRWIKLSNKDAVLLVNMHHIISDGWSVGVLLDELSQLYEGYCQGREVYLKPLPVQYVDYAVWQREQLQGDLLNSQIDYWREILKDAPPLLSLPLDHPRPAVQSHRGAVVKMALDSELVDGLKALAQREGLTLFMVLLAGYHLLLSRLSGQTDLSVGIPVAGRNRRELEGLVGFFINAVVIRLDLSGKPTLGELFHQVKERTLGAYGHQEVPAEQLLEALKVERNLSYGPLAQVSFTLQNIPVGKDFHLGGAEAELLEYGQVTAKYDLTLLLEETQDGIKGVAEYATDIFERSTIEAFLAQYERVLRQFLSLERDRRIAGIELVTGELLLEELGLDSLRYSDVYPLTSMQRDLYLSWQLRPETLENSLGYAVELHHEVNVPAWRAALQRYLERYGVLRSELIRGRQSWHEDIYRVEIAADKAVLPLEVIDLSDRHWSEAEIASLIRSRIECPYTEEQPLLNHYLYKLGPNHWLTIMSSHHLLLDGVGYATHLLGACRLYEQGLRGELLEDLPEDRYGIAIARDREEVDCAEVLSYWQEELSGLQALCWRTDESLGHERRRLRATLSEEERLQIQSYCRRHKVTPALYWKSLYSLLISGLTVGAGDVVLQEFSSGRRADEENELGCFYRLRPYVLRQAALHMGARFSDWLEASRDFHRRSRQHDAISILSQNRWLGVREPAYLYNYIHFYPELEVCGHKERIEQLIPQAEGAVQFVVKGVGQGLELSLDAEQRYLPRGDELEIILALNQSLQNGIDKLNDLHWSESQESRYMMRRWQEEQTKGLGIRPLLERSLQLYPEQEALVCGSQRLSYAELDRLSRVWLERLIELGLKPGSRVILNAHRSVAGIVAWLSLVRLGCCYIPLEGDQPLERLKWICQESHAELLLQEPGLAQLSDVKSSDANQVGEIKRVTIADANKTSAVNSSTFVWNGVTNDSSRLFYQIYTSGSTGEPKGVQVREEAVTHLCHWYIEEYDFKPSDRHLLLGSLNFDLTQKNLYGVLASGGTLILPEVEGYDADRLKEQIERERVTVINGAPSVIYPLLSENSGNELRLILFGGERIELSRIRDWVKTHQTVEFVNMYGPTECTDISTANRKSAEWVLAAAQSGEEWSLGQPIPGVVVEINNRFGRAVPRGVEGEFWIGGTGIGLGYTDPTLTAEKFVGEGENRRYRSGDRGFELISISDLSVGELMYLGRLDRQVKLRGMRLELGEIESALRRGLSVSEVYAEAVDDQLIGYLRTAVASDWRSRLGSYLPVSLIPSRLITVENWPLTVNGKLDRKRLQELARLGNEQSEIAEPRTEREAKLLQIWQEVLGRERIGIYDNFFELGGHSLLAFRLISRAREIWQIEMPISLLFTSQTIASMATAMKQYEEKPSTWPLLIPMQSTGTKTPLFCIHSGVGWITLYTELVKQLGPDYPVYGIEQQGFQPGQTLAPDVETMAQHYIAAIKEVQPQGPYQLLGHSFGGVVAFAMAQLLREKGDEVSFIGLLDSFNPAHALSVYKNSVYRDEEVEGLLLGGVSQTDLKMELTTRISDLIHHNTRIALQYQMRPYPGNVCHFAADKTTTELKSIAGWDRVVEGELKCYVVPGDHFSMMALPQVITLAELIRAQLR